MGAPRSLAVADVIGRIEQAAEVEAACEQLLAGLPDAVRDTTVAVIRPAGDGQFRIDSGPAARDQPRLGHGAHGAGRTGAAGPGGWSTAAATTTPAELLLEAISEALGG